jgi:proline racemase
MEPLPTSWHPPDHWLKVAAIDMHTGGEPLRVFVSGLPEIRGTTVLEKRRFFRDNYDHLRTALLWEPRGHADMYGAIITPSADADADVFFLHNEGYSTMCGHAIIALTRFLTETGMIRKTGPLQEIVLNVPAGRVRARALMEKERHVVFRNVPSFVYRQDQYVDVTGFGTLRYDVAYGGAFYAFVEAADLGLPLTPDRLPALIDAGRRIKAAVMSALEITHPFEPELSFLYGTIFTAKAHHPDRHSRNVCIFADGEVDRSPTGTGVSARAALHHARGELATGRTITIESIVGSTMTVEAVATTIFGPYPAVIPEVGGCAYFTGRNELWMDPEDPFRKGFFLR